MSAHTPGPWVAGRLARSSAVVANGHHVIARLSEGTLAEVEANARLIAAAPDMLAALQRVVQDWRHPYDDGEFEDGEMPALDMARAALVACTREKQS